MQGQDHEPLDDRIAVFIGRGTTGRRVHLAALDVGFFPPNHPRINSEAMATRDSCGSRGFPALGLPHRTSVTSGGKPPLPLLPLNPRNTTELRRILKW